MKFIIKYEVEGCWSKPGQTRCGYCDTLLEETPREGHYNSQYWNLQRDDGVLLLCCPNGCSVKKADRKREFPGIVLPVEKIELKDIVYLEITTWSGMSIGAIHYYGKLKQDYIISSFETNEEVQRKINAKEARVFNKKDQTDIWESGMLTNRFNSETQLKKRAVKVFKKIFPKTKVLIAGDTGVYQPQEILVGPPNYMATINSLYNIGENCGSWEGNETKMKKICKLWDKYHINKSKEK